MKKMDIRSQIMIAIVYNVVQTAVCICFGIGDQAYFAALAMPIPYIIFTQVTNRGNMPWSAYFVYLFGAGVQIVLNFTGFIPPDGGFFPGLGQFFYCVLLIAAAILLGIVNLISFIICKCIEKRNKQTPRYDGVYPQYGYGYGYDYNYNYNYNAEMPAADNGFIGTEPQ